MRETLQTLFNFIHDNLGKDDTIIGLSGLNRENEYVFITTPPELKKTRIQDIENNYLLL